MRPVGHRPAVGHASPSSEGPREAPAVSVQGSGICPVSCTLDAPRPLKSARMGSVPRTDADTASHLPRPVPSRAHLRRRRRPGRLPGRAGRQPPLLLAVPPGRARQHPRLRRRRPQPAQRRAGRRGGLRAAVRRPWRAEGLGQVVDIVPNHMATVGGPGVVVVGRPRERPVEPVRGRLRHRLGPARGASCASRVLLPVLGDHYGRVLEAGELRWSATAARFVVRYYDHARPRLPAVARRAAGHRCGGRRLRRAGQPGHRPRPPAPGQRHRRRQRGGAPPGQGGAAVAAGPPAR